MSKVKICEFSYTLVNYIVLSSLENRQATFVPRERLTACQFACLIYRSARLLARRVTFYHLYWRLEPKIKLVPSAALKHLLLLKFAYISSLVLDDLSSIFVKFNLFEQLRGMPPLF